VNQESNSGLFSESEAYERFMGCWSRKLAPSFLKLSGLENGDSVLDVGSGTGALAEAVLVESELSRVVGVDPSNAYVAYAQSRTDNDRATFEVGDAQELRFADGTFDKTMSLLVINFIPDPHKALNEMMRVTRVGGVAVAAVWDYDHGMEMLRVFWDEAVALDPLAELRDERHMPFCRSGELADLWRDQGLVEVREEALVIPMEFQSFEDFWLPFLEGQGPAGTYVVTLDEGERLKLKERLRQRLDVESTSGPIELSARAWVVRGLIPER
jgi:SAM-dependent methyltransferase